MATYKVVSEKRGKRLYVEIKGVEIFFDGYNKPFVPLKNKGKVDFMAKNFGKKGAVLVKKNQSEYLILFGQAGAEDYRMHKDNKRRDSYLKRAMGIKNKKGEITAFDSLSANYWSIKCLWN